MATDEEKWPSERRRTCRTDREDEVGDTWTAAWRSGGADLANQIGHLLSLRSQERIRNVLRSRTARTRRQRRRDAIVQDVGMLKTFLPDFFSS